MDEMRLKASSKFMKKIVSKILSNYIRSTTGCKVTISIDEFDFWAIDGNTNVRLAMDAKLNSDEFTKIMKTIYED